MHLLSVDFSDSANMSHHTIQLPLHFKPYPSFLCTLFVLCIFIPLIVFFEQMNIWTVLYESCGRKSEPVTRFWVSEIINDDVMASARIYQARLQMIKSYAQQSLA